MSAWDVAGAVVWTPLALLSWFALLNSETNAAGKVVCLPFVFGWTGLSVYCIARLCGAHA